MVTSTTQALFGPLSRKYCDWFYWLAVISFIFMFLTVVSGLYGMLMHKMKTEYIFAIMWTAATYGVFYFQNRLLYTMCVK